MNAAASTCLSLSMPQARPGKHAQQGPQAFAAAADDVFGDLVHQGHDALEPGADHGVHTLEVGFDTGPDFVETHDREPRRHGARGGKWAGK